MTSLRSFGRRLQPGNSPRSHQPGRLLSLVAREFDGFQPDYPAPGRAEFTAADNSLTFNLAERMEKQFLAYTVIAEFEYIVKGSEPGKGEIHLSHMGNLKRTGIHARIKAGGERPGAAARQLTGDELFAQTILPLDFKYFYLILDERGWRIKTSQVGAAWVSMTFPPMRRYVPMGQDQVKTLLATFSRLQQLLGS
jgi:hypothetical protein